MVRGSGKGQTEERVATVAEVPRIPRQHQCACAGGGELLHMLLHCHRICAAIWPESGVEVASEVVRGLVRRQHCNAASSQCERDCDADTCNAPLGATRGGRFQSGNCS